MRSHPITNSNRVSAMEDFPERASDIEWEAGKARTTPTKDRHQPSLKIFNSSLKDYPRSISPSNNTEQ
jgi:hypothetical protein